MKENPPPLADSGTWTYHQEMQEIFSRPVREREESEMDLAERLEERLRRASATSPTTEEMNAEIDRRARVDPPRVGSRPAWAAAPRFNACWAGMESAARVRRGTQAGTALRFLLRDWLSRAQVVTIEKEQAEVLPMPEKTATPLEPSVEEACRVVEQHSGDDCSVRDMFEVQAWTAHLFDSLPLPFEPLFLDLGGVETDLTYPNGAAGLIQGCFLSRGDSGLLGGEDDIRGMVFLRNPAGSQTTAWPGVSLGEIEHGGNGDAFAHLDNAGNWSQCHAALSCLGYQTAAAVLLWLESVNVEIVETPMKPKRRKRQIEKGRQIALTVSIKQSKRRSDSAAGGHRDYSHRFEVRGHYKHHFEEKPNGDLNKVFERYANKHPDKVLNIQGQRCVRFWTPPYVKGPGDKPLVPKVRVVEAV